jgi:hypothetical protein
MNERWMDLDASMRAIGTQLGMMCANMDSVSHETGLGSETFNKTLTAINEGVMAVLESGFNPVGDNDGESKSD